MSLLVHPHDKARVIDLLRNLCRTLMYKNLKFADQAAIEAHFNAMEALAEPMNIQLTFETVPSLSLTKIGIEAGFVARPEVKQ